MRDAPFGGHDNFSRLPVTDVQIGVWHADFHAKGAGFGVRGTRQERHLTRDLFTRGQPRACHSPDSHLSDVRFWDEADKFDRV